MRRRIVAVGGIELQVSLAQYADTNAVLFEPSLLAGVRRRFGPRTSGHFSVTIGASMRNGLPMPSTNTPLPQPVSLSVRVWVVASAPLLCASSPDLRPCSGTADGPAAVAAAALRFVAQLPHIPGRWR